MPAFATGVFTSDEEVTQTALILPLEPVDESVEAFRNVHDPAANLGLPAHITLIFPFIPLLGFDADAERALERLMRESAGFSFELDRVETFDDVAYLAPVSDGPLVQLIQSLTQSFPAYLPYAGAFETVIPHLTVGGKGCADQAAREIDLPVRGVADRASLLRDSGERWVTHKHFRLCGLA